MVPLSFYVCYGSFSLNSALFIHSQCQTGSQPMSGRYYIINIVSHVYTDTMLCDLKYEYTIVHTVLHVYFLAPLSIIGITGFCLTLWFLIFRYYEYTYICVSILLENLKFAFIYMSTFNSIYFCMFLIFIYIYNYYFAFHACQVLASFFSSIILTKVIILQIIFHFSFYPFFTRHSYYGRTLNKPHMSAYCTVTWAN